MCIVESGNKVESEVKPFAPVAVSASENGEPFEPTDDVFDQQTAARQLFVFALLFGGERLFFGFFVRCARVLVMFGDALVAAVGQTGGGFEQGQAALFEQSKVMGFAQTKIGANQALIFGSHEQLRFARVALFLAAVALALFFLGRSTGVWVASMITT